MWIVTFILPPGSLPDDIYLYQTCLVLLNWWVQKTAANQEIYETFKTVVAAEMVSADMMKKVTV